MSMILKGRAFVCCPALNPFPYKKTLNVAKKAFTPGQEGEPGVNTSFGDFIDKSSFEN